MNKADLVSSAWTPIGAAGVHVSATLPATCQLTLIGRVRDSWVLCRHGKFTHGGSLALKGISTEQQGFQMFERMATYLQYPAYDHTLVRRKNIVGYAFKPSCHVCQNSSHKVNSVLILS